MLTHMLLMMIISLLTFFTVWSCPAAESPRSDNASPAHHTPKGFRNLYSDSDRGLGALLKWQLGMGPHEPPHISPDEMQSYKPAVSQPELNRIKNPDPDQIQITWVGHSTFLIQMDGVNILTDPIFNDRSSPFSFGGFKRLAEPGIQFEDLPPIHVVLISHDHYDHLDKHTIERLANRPKYFIPLGLARWFKKRRLDHLIELDWWQSASLRELKFHCVPVQHFSGRSPFDRNRTLWSGWIVEGKNRRIFFVGDTGYSQVFKEIGERFGPIRVSLIPIGAYMPRWFMRPVHVNPPEAIGIHQDTKSQQSVASHWGTFKLSDEPIGEPPLYLEKALKETGIEKNKFLIMKLGETLPFR